MGKIESSERILYVVVAALVVFGGLAFFRAPSYEKGVWAVIALLVLVATNIMTFKFTAHQAKLPPGTDQVSVTKTPQEKNNTEAAE